MHLTARQSEKLLAHPLHICTTVYRPRSHGSSQRMNVTSWSRGVFGLGTLDPTPRLQLASTQARRPTVLYHAFLLKNYNGGDSVCICHVGCVPLSPRRMPSDIKLLIPISAWKNWMVTRICNEGMLHTTQLVALGMQVTGRRICMASV